MSAPTTLTAGQRRTLEALVYQHRRGLDVEGTPAYLHPRGGQHRVLNAWEKLGLVQWDWCAHEDRNGADEVLCAGLTSQGEEWARSHGFVLEPESMNAEDPEPQKRCLDCGGIAQMLAGHCGWCGGLAFEGCDDAWSAPAAREEPAGRRENSNE